MFFGGNVFAPHLRIQNVPAQDFLQNHFFSAIQQLIQAIVANNLHDTVVLGYDTFNEPLPGYIGVQDLSKLAPFKMTLGPTPTLFQGFLLGDGNTVTIDTYKRSPLGFSKDKKIQANPKGVRAWRNECLWSLHGVWDPKTKKLLDPGYFGRNPQDPGQKIDFLADFWRPFVIRYTERVRSLHPTALIFLEPSVNELPPNWHTCPDCPKQGLVYAPHWYDGFTLLKKQFSRLFTYDYVGYMRGYFRLPTEGLAFGIDSIRKSFERQLNRIKNEGLAYIGKCDNSISLIHNFHLYIGENPCLIGEIGIPFDMKANDAYETGNYTDQILALDASLRAVEANLLSYCIWNYCPDNVNSHGDQWNGEDLSIYSPMAKTASSSARPRNLDPNLYQQLYMGGRALETAIRPYPKRTSGVPKSLRYDYYKDSRFRYEYTAAGSGSMPTVIYFPRLHYRGWHVEIECSPGVSWFLQEGEQQLLVFHQEEHVGSLVWVSIERVSPDSNGSKLFACL